VECADRIAVMTEERVIEPIRLMGEYGSLSAVTVRVVAGRRLWDVTVRRLAPASGPQRYAWRAVEVDAAGEASVGGTEIDGADGPEAVVADPEAAYWCAVEAIAGAERPRGG